MKRMKDTHLQEFLEAETAWKEKTDALQLKVQNCYASKLYYFT